LEEHWEEDLDGDPLEDDPEGAPEGEKAFASLVVVGNGQTQAAGTQVGVQIAEA